MQRNMFTPIYFLVIFTLVLPLCCDGHFRRVNPLMCTPTEVLQAECYECRCSVSGFYRCSPVTCADRKQTVLTSKSSQTPQQKCQPGVFYRTRNLTCTCSSHGLWYTDECENIFKGLNNIQEADSEIQEQVANNTEQGLKCTPGSLYVADCNICVCSKTGDFHLSLCTKRNCKTHHSTKCNSGSVIRTRCHLCSCTYLNNIDPEKCVKIACDMGFKEIDSDTLSEMALHEGKGEHRRNIKEHGVSECVPETAFMMDCNRCYCAKDGSPSCTLMGCLDRVEVEEFKSNLEKRRRANIKTFHDDASHRMKRDTDSGIEFEKVLFSDDFESENIHGVENQKVSDNLSNRMKRREYGEKPKQASFDTDKYEKEKIVDDVSDRMKRDAYLESELERNKQAFLNKVSDRIRRDTDSGTDFEEVLTDSDKCVRGNVYRMDCNTCICVRSGDLACTSRVCEGDYDYVNNNNNPQYILPEMERF